MSKEIEVRVGGLETTVKGHAEILKEHGRTLVEHATDIIMMKDSIDRNTKAHEDLLKSHKEMSSKQDQTNIHLQTIVGGFKGAKTLLITISILVGIVGAVIKWF